jgi:hypothetical protein
MRRGRQKAATVEGSEARTMTEILATKAPVPEDESPGTLEGVRAGALFLSALQPSASPGPDQIRRAVTTTLQRRGVRGCAAQVAGEFGDHPDTAAARMSWALAAIGAAYPVPPVTRAPGPRPLAFAS